MLKYYSLQRMCAGHLSLISKSSDTSGQRIE